MKNDLPQRIGRVPITWLNGSVDEDYLDNAEDLLLDLFSNQKADINTKREEILSSNPSWPLYYHLSPNRVNLLRWYEFKNNASILEIGAGCGAITEELVKNQAKITALELTTKRALINAHRNSKAQNLEIIAGNFGDYSPSHKYDYMVCVGVLEYAGTFFHSNDPYLDFLKKLRDTLKPSGKLLLAIENRFGLKYWAGAREDHTHSFFEGHNGYSGGGKVQTFGKRELNDLIEAAGFNKTSFYYPYPDYKTPFFIYSDAYYPGNGASFPLGRLPTPTLDRPREHFFSEQNAMRFIEKNGLFPEFSNSFFVEAEI